MQRLLTRGHCVCASSAPRPSFLPSFSRCWNWVTKLHEHVLPSSMFGWNWLHQPCRCGFAASSLEHAAGKYSTLLFPFWSVCISWGMLKCCCWHARRCSVYVMWRQRHRQTLHLLLLLLVMPAGPGCSFHCSSWCRKQFYRAER